MFLKPSFFNQQTIDNKVYVSFMDLEKCSCSITLSEDDIQQLYNRMMLEKNKHADKATKRALCKKLGIRFYA